MARCGMTTFGIPKKTCAELKRSPPRMTKKERDLHDFEMYWIVLTHFKKPESAVLMTADELKSFARKTFLAARF
jgi:hypothetical protein